MEFKPTPLFGGAITSRLPTSYMDASDLRQVPSHQEVWIDAGGYSSVVFEILERVEGEDEEAVEEHVRDLVAEGDGVRMEGRERVVMEKMSTTPAYSITLIVTSAPTAPTSSRKQPLYTHIHLLLLRLAAQKTDILISVNSPHYAGEFESPAEEGGETGLMKGAGRLREQVLGSFEVLDWGLFEGEEAT